MVGASGRVNREIEGLMLERPAVSRYMKEGIVARSPENLSSLAVPSPKEPRWSMREDNDTAVQEGPVGMKQEPVSEDQTPAELFAQMSHIAITLSYDLVDKLRYWEKETLGMRHDEIEKRLGHMAVLLERLKKAYVDFAETDL